MSDTLFEIKCPSCGEVMSKYSLEGQNFMIDVCENGCGGIFLNNRETKALSDDPSSLKKIFNLLKDKSLVSVEDNPINCPVCRSVMVKNFVKGKDFKVDECYNCGSKFFNRDELFKIIQK